MLNFFVTAFKCQYLPRNTSRFHVVGQGDIVGPDVELPLAQSQHAAQHVARVNSNSHVNVEASRFTNKSVNAEVFRL
jgi:hypothetical protein